jgi:TonB family protein
MSKKLLKDFIHAHIMYPEKAQVEKKEGRVTINFKIDKKGQITDREVTKSVSPEVDHAALQLFDLILWQPAKEYGIPVESLGKFEIQYNLKKYAKYVKARGYDQIKFENLKTDTTNNIYHINQLTKPPSPNISKEYGSLENFISNEMKYPEQAQKLGIRGRVKLTFIIELNGIPSNIHVKETLGGGCCEESIRILQLISWIPGIKEDMYVRTKYDLVIHFNPAENPTQHIPNQSNTGL